MNLITLYGMLQGFGIKPVVADSGKQAVRYFKEKFTATCCTNKFELVLTDINMPEMDGIRVAECIRAIEFSWADPIAKKS